MNDICRQTLAVLVDNESGVLAKIVNLFSRKGFNIESLSVGPTELEGVSRITIEIFSDEDGTALLVNQLRKLFPVHSVKRLMPEISIRRELALIKVSAKSSDVRSEIIQIANIFHSSVIDVSVDSLTIAVIGDETKIEAIKKLLEQHGIIEMVRTGTTGLERGNLTIVDQTKVKSEFDMGKNVR